MRSLVWTCLLLLSLNLPASAQDSLPFATDGTVTHSPVPLEVFRHYYVTLKSPYDLRAIWSHGPNWTIRFDGRPYKEQEYPLLTTWDYQHAMNAMRFRYTGTGQPVALQFAVDLSKHIPKAIVEIEPVPVYHNAILTGFATVMVGIIVIGGTMLLCGYLSDRFGHKTDEEWHATEEAQRARDYQDVYIRAQQWKVNAEAYKNFRHREFYEDYAKTKLEEVLKNPTDYLYDYQKLLKDTPVYNYIKHYLPDTLAIYHGRAETFHTAQRLNAQRKTPEEYQQDQLRWAEIQQERKILVTVSAFTQYVEKKARLRQEAHDLIVKYPHMKEVIEAAYTAFEPPNPNEPKKETTDVPAEPQPPEPEYF